MASPLTCPECTWRHDVGAVLEELMTAAARFEKHLVAEHGVDKAVAAERARAYLVERIPSARARPPSGRTPLS